MKTKVKEEPLCYQVLLNKPLFMKPENKNIYGFRVLVDEENKDLLNAIKDALGSDVKAVRLSNRMKSRAVCLTADGEVSLEMEKVFRSMRSMQAMPMKAEKVLEINPEHKLFSKLQTLLKTDKEKLKKYAKIMYAQTLITEGFPIENSDEFASLLSDVLSE